MWRWLFGWVGRLWKRKEVVAPIPLEERMARYLERDDEYLTAEFRRDRPAHCYKGANKRYTVKGQ